MLLEPESRATLVGRAGCSALKRAYFSLTMFLLLNSSSSISQCLMMCWSEIGWVVPVTTLRICSCVLVNAREELRFILVQKHFHSTFLSAYHSMLHQESCVHFKGIDVGVDGRITSPRNSPIDSVQELQFKGFAVCGRPKSYRPGIKDMWKSQLLSIYIN